MKAPDICPGFCFVIQEITIFYIIKTLCGGAACAETKMHLSAHTGAHRVTK